MLLSETGVPQLVDFHASKRNDGRTYSLVGAVDCVAPEMLSSGGHTEAVDWWALGVTLYFCLCGRMPFTGSDSAQVRQRSVD